MGADLVTLTEYKTYALIASTNSDALITALIPKISALVKNLCNRAFVDYVTIPKVEYFDGGHTTMDPAEFPLIAVTSLEQSLDFGNTYTSLVQFTDYIISNTTGSIYPMQFTPIISTSYKYKFVRKPDTPIFPRIINGYRLTYTAGYVNLPEDLKLAILDLITYYIKHDAAIHSNRAPGGNTIQIEYVTTTSLPSHIRRILDLYATNYA